MIVFKSEVGIPGKMGFRITTWNGKDFSLPIGNNLDADKFQVNGIRSVLPLLARLQRIYKLMHLQKSFWVSAMERKAYFSGP